MTELAELGIEVKSDDIRKAVRELDRLERQGEQTEKATSKLKRATSALNKSYSGLGAIIGAAGLGLAMRSIIKATVEQERAMKQLETAVESTGGTAGFTARELADFASELQGVTTFGDEAIISMQSVLLTFTNLKDDVLPQTTEAVLNLSTRMGQDLQSSAVMLGKALNDPVSNLGALSRSGIQFSDEQKEVIKDLADTNRLAEAQGIILEELETQFGGAAKAARDTFGGALAGLQNTLGDLLEAEGGSLKEAQEAVEGLTQALKDPEVQESLASITAGVVNLTSAFAKALPKAVDFTEWVAEELAVAMNGVSSNDIPRMTLALKDIEDQISKINDGKFQLSDLWTSAAHKEQLEKEAAQLRENIELARERQLEMRMRGIGGEGDSGAEEGTGLMSTGGDVKKPSVLGIPTEDEADEELERLREKFATKREILEEEYAADLELLDTRLLNERISEEEHGELLNRMNADYADERIKMSEREAQAKQETGELLNKGMTALMRSGNKEMFEIGKAASLARAVVALPSAVMQSFENGGGYPWGLIPAGLMLATGLQQINAIRSASFDGGGSAPSVGGGGAPSSAGGPGAANTVPETTPDLGQQQPQQQLIVNLGDDDRPVSKSWVRDNLIPTIKDAQKDGYVLA